jgi:hypothetical protein
MTHRSLFLALAALLVASCNSDSVTASTPLATTSTRSDISLAGPPVIVNVSPDNGAINVPRTANINAEFNEAMDSSSIDSASFQLKRGTNRIWQVTVSYAFRKAKLNPTYLLRPNTTYTAIITTDVKDATGTHMAVQKTWTFTTVATGADGPAPVNLGTAGNYVILAKSGVSTTGTTAITGNVGLSPAASTYITGFSLIMDPSNRFATSSHVTGRAYAASYAPPTPSALTTAVGDMETAYTDAAGRSIPDFTELGAGNINGKTLTPGLYKWSSGVQIPVVVTLKGDKNAVWIFQIAQNLTVANGAQVTLAGGANPAHIFWQVAGQVTLGTTSHFKGIVLSKTLIAMKTGTIMDGRALAQTAVTLGATQLTRP